MQSIEFAFFLPASPPAAEAKKPDPALSAPLKAQCCPVASLGRINNMPLALKKHGPQALGRSRGGFGTQIHGLIDALGNPVGFTSSSDALIRSNNSAVSPRAMRDSLLILPLWSLVGASYCG